MTTSTTTPQKTSIRSLVYMATFAALIAACSWIAIPTTVPFTMQTFAVFLTLTLLGGKRGTMTVVVYLLLGAVGAPVFANFAGGLGILVGSTGGYLVGFLAQTLLYWAVIKSDKPNRILEIVVLVIGLFICYALGTIWFVVVYSAANEAIGIGTALSWCVIPYIVPDLVKLGLAFTIGDRLRKYVRV